MASQSSSAAPRQGDDFPRLALIIIGGAMALSIVFAATARFTGFGVHRVEQGTVIGTQRIVFAEQADGTATITHAPDGRLLERLPADGSGFLRGVLRAELRQRRLASQDLSAPFALNRRADGRHYLVDPLSGRRMELDGFGPTNTLAVARLFDAAARTVEKSSGDDSRTDKKN